MNGDCNKINKIKKTVIKIWNKIKISQKSKNDILKERNKNNVIVTKK